VFKNPKNAASASRAMASPVTLFDVTAKLADSLGVIKGTF
jgi:hypothetical protein